MNVEVVNVVLIVVSGLEGNITKCQHDNESFSISYKTIFNKCLSVVVQYAITKECLDSIDVKITE